jgi:hypothetical protein
MDKQPKKRRGPITLFCESRRFRRFVIVPSVVILVAISIAVLRTQFRDLKTQMSRVSPGMTREQVEGIFGPPGLFVVDGQPGMGGTLIWVDQLWQVDVVLDGDGTVMRCGCTRSYSALNRAIGRAPNLSF